LESLRNLLQQRQQDRLSLKLKVKILSASLLEDCLEQIQVLLVYLERKKKQSQTNKHQLLSRTFLTKVRPFSLDQYILLKYLKLNQSQQLEDFLGQNQLLQSQKKIQNHQCLQSLKKRNKKQE